MIGVLVQVWSLLLSAGGQVERVFEAVYEHEVASVEAERHTDVTVREE
jgi:hypothetical protein